MMDLKEKIKTNTWDSIDDFIKVMNEARAGNWYWFKNTKCKYVELRVDMRDGGCIIKDRDGNRIDPTELAFQYGMDATTTRSVPQALDFSEHTKEKA